MISWLFHLIVRGRKWILSLKNSERILPSDPLADLKAETAFLQDDIVRQRKLHVHIRRRCNKLNRTWLWDKHVQRVSVLLRRFPSQSHKHGYRWRHKHWPTGSRGDTKKTLFIYYFLSKIVKGKIIGKKRCAHIFRSWNTRKLSYSHRLRLSKRPLHRVPHGVRQQARLLRSIRWNELWWENNERIIN